MYPFLDWLFHYSIHDMYVCIFIHICVWMWPYWWNEHCASVWGSRFCNLSTSLNFWEFLYFCVNHCMWLTESLLSHQELSSVWLIIDVGDILLWYFAPHYRWLIVTMNALDKALAILAQTLITCKICPPFVILLKKSLTF